MGMVSAWWLLSHTAVCHYLYVLAFPSLLYFCRPSWAQRYCYNSATTHSLLKVVVQLLSHVWLFATPWTAAHQASLSIAISLSLLKLMSIELMMPSNLLILCHPLPLLPSIFPNIRVCFSKWALLIRWVKYWSLSFSISPFNEYSGLISFRIDWFDLLAV